MKQKSSHYLLPIFLVIVIALAYQHFMADASPERSGQESTGLLNTDTPDPVNPPPVLTDWEDSDQVSPPALDQADTPDPASPTSQNPINPLSQAYQVLQVVDGDTLWLDMDGQREKIRLLQINTPEVNNPSIPLGQAASDFTKDFVQDQMVLLEYDVERHDQYGRLLAYLYVQDQGGNLSCLNEELVRQGLAKVVRYGKNTLRYDAYKKIEDQARQDNIGIWQDIKANYPPKHK